MASQLSGRATGSMVFGVLGVLCMVPIISPLIAVILGHLALVDIKRSNDQVDGKAMAITGLILGYMGVLIVPIVFMMSLAMLTPALTKAREKARRINCAGNIKQIGIAIALYSNDHEGNAPESLADITEYLPPGIVFICPSAQKHNQTPATKEDLANGMSSYDYVGNGINIDKVENPTSFVILRDHKGNHEGGWTNFLYADGHVDGTYE
ncbi:DUF4190 domain-containing protein [bacterium AH-315-E10]|nr:DUF4190 domain-containing protein [bacterium AH-315-E10]